MMKAKKYWPLAALILIAILAASALSIATTANHLGWMHFFMGFFLCQFAMLKLFHPSGFADGFQMYDLIGSRIRAYALIYPYIELILGLGYLSLLFPTWIYALTIIILGIGAIGVLLALRKGLNVKCVCMGTALDVPLSTVTLTEDLVMVAMAIFLLLN